MKKIFLIFASSFILGISASIHADTGWTKIEAQDPSWDPLFQNYELSPKKGIFCQVTTDHHGGVAFYASDRSYRRMIVSEGTVTMKGGMLAFNHSEHNLDRKSFNNEGVYSVFEVHCAEPAKEASFVCSSKVPWSVRNQIIFSVVIQNTQTL